MQAGLIVPEQVVLLLTVQISVGLHEKGQANVDVDQM